MYISDKAAQDEHIQSELARIAVSGSNQFERGAAIKKLANQKLLEELALYDNFDFIRREATSRLENQDILSQISLQDSNEEVRQAAVRKLSNSDLLGSICLNDSHPKVREAAVKSLSKDIQHIFCQVAVQDPNWTVRFAAVWKLQDQELLSQIAQSDKKSEVRKAAVDKLSIQEVLFELALHDNDYKVREAAAQKLDLPHLIEQLLQQSIEAELRELLIPKITNQQLLRQVALEDDARWVRDTAVAHLHDVEENISTFCQIACNDPDENVRYTALKKVIEDQLLLEIINSSSYLDTCKAAVQRIRSVELLALLRLTAPATIQEEVVRRIQILEGMK